MRKLNRHHADLPSYLIEAGFELKRSGATGGLYLGGLWVRGNSLTGNVPIPRDVEQVVVRYEQETGREVTAYTPSGE